MKKIIFAVTMILFVSAGFCQSAPSAPIPLKTKHTITGADTITHSLVGSKVVSLTATYVETSGTSAGKFYIEGSGDGIGWQNIDSSKSLSDVTTAQTIVVAVTATTYQSYRLRCSNTSAATASLYFTVTRRPDDREPMPCPLPLAKSKFIPLSLYKSGDAAKFDFVWQRSN